MTARGKRTVLAVSLAAFVVVAATAWASLRKMDRGPDIPVTEVHQQDFVRRVTAEGNLKAVKATPLTAPMDADFGLKIAWLVPEGSRVRAGEVVVRFDPTEMQKNLQDGNDDRSTADHRITGRRVEDHSAMRNLDRDAQVAALELDYARRFQTKDAEIFSRMEIIESEIDERLSATKVDHAKGVRSVRQEQSTADIALLGIDRRKAGLKIDQAEKGLRSLEVTAPHDGLFVLRRDWGSEIVVGDTVWPGQPLAEIPDLTEMEAEIFVLEADAGGLTVGRPARVTVESQPDRSFGAKVKKVDAIAKPRNRWLPVQYFGVVLALDKTDPAVMKPGQRIRADLVLEERRGALVVPREAVIDEDGKKIVYRKNQAGAFDPVTVVLGPAALGKVVVEKGLARGDVVALRDPTAPEESAGEAAEEGGGGPGGRRGGGGRRGPRGPGMKGRR